MLDVYYANYYKNEKPKASAIGVSSRQSFGETRNSVGKPYYSNKDDSKSVSKTADVETVPVVAKSKYEATAKRCFK